MKRPAILVAIVLGLILAAGGGYLAGSRAERAAMQPAVLDAQASKTLVVIRRDIQLLTERRKRSFLALVRAGNFGIVLHPQQTAPANFSKASVPDRLYPQTLEMIDAYRKQFPDTIIDPDKDKTIAKAFGKTS